MYEKLYVQKVMFGEGPVTGTEKELNTCVHMCIPFLVSFVFADFQVFLLTTCNRTHRP